MVKYKIKEISESPIIERTYTYYINYSLVWITERGRDLLVDESIIEALKDKFITIANEGDFEIYSINIGHNFISMKVGAKPKQTVTSIIKRLKGISGKWLATEYGQQLGLDTNARHIWNSNYFVATGTKNEDKIEKYLKTQIEKYK